VAAGRCVATAATRSTPSSTHLAARGGVAGDEREQRGNGAGYTFGVGGGDGAAETGGDAERVLALAVRRELADERLDRHGGWAGRFRLQPPDASPQSAVMVRSASCVLTIAFALLDAAERCSRSSRR
jgi:hypothetical protein